MDPLEKHSDDHIWGCIHNSNMTDYIDKMPNGLNTIIETGGVGLSNGEKQVITCIRGLLSRFNAKPSWGWLWFNDSLKEFGIILKLNITRVMKSVCNLITCTKITSIIILMIF